MAVTIMEYICHIIYCLRIMGKRCSYQSQHKKQFL
ncbi:unnamed protein product [Paramecium primaurelia]|uniref:Uncharacterized protein n=1 Tax=Paramecium primaurelia TaxID=5886 RepID=A0A8S1NDI7_PARPR|nr:unnamed protein product [Paramecium primaurelia]